MSCAFVTLDVLLLLSSRRTQQDHLFSLRKVRVRCIMRNGPALLCWLRFSLLSCLFSQQEQQQEQRENIVQDDAYSHAGEA